MRPEERRGSVRVTTRMEVSFHGEMKDVAGVIEDISLKGMRCRFPTELLEAEDSREHYDCSFSLPAGSVRLKAHIVWLRTGIEHGEEQAGFVIESIDDPGKLAMESFFELYA